MVRAPRRAFTVTLGVMNSMFVRHQGRCLARRRTARRCRCSLAPSLLACRRLPRRERYRLVGGRLHRGAASAFRDAMSLHAGTRCQDRLWSKVPAGVPARSRTLHRITEGACRRRRGADNCSAAASSCSNGRSQGGRSVKMILTPAKSPNQYVGYLGGWQRLYVEALREAVRSTAPELEERLKWGHLVYLSNGPVLLIRAEPSRVLFGFFRGKRLTHIENRLKGGGKHELRTLELRQDTPLSRETVLRLVPEAVSLNARLGDPTTVSRSAEQSAV